MKKTLLSLLLFLAISTLLCGCKKDKDVETKGSIYGVVADKATGEPIKNAGVKLNPLGLNTVTGSEGQFEFVEVESGSYTLFVTKTGYSDLSSSITVNAGQQAKADLQMEKLPHALRVVDANLHDISELDFGDQENDISRSFVIFNDGVEKLEWDIVITAQWLSVNKTTGSLNAGKQQTLIATVNRALLQNGSNETTMNITSDDGAKDLKVKAIGVSDIETHDATEITKTSALLNGKLVRQVSPQYTERGFVYGTMPTPSLTNGAINVNCGAAEVGSFSETISGLKESTKYYVRAYAKNSTKTAYGTIKSFETNGPYVILSSANLMVQKEDLGCVDLYSAISMCENSTVGGYTDWRLPSKDELMTLYTNRNYIGGFTTSKYWSSSLYNSLYYYYIDFKDGSIYTTYYVSSNYRVRAVRTLNGGGTTTLSVSPTSLSFESSASTKTCSVQSNSSWSVTSSQSWCTVSPSSGSNNGTLSVSVTANTSSSSRTATVTVTAGTKTCTVNVTQSGYNGGSSGDEFFEGFENDLPSDWITIDLDGDENNWFVIGEAEGIATHGGTKMMTSASYDNDDGVLTPDNWLISPLVALGSSSEFSFYVCAQDADWPSEHFGVAVLDVDYYYTMVWEGTLTAKNRSNPQPGARGQRTQGNWYRISVDLGEYAGQDMHIAIRHFDCTDMYRINVDDVQLSNSKKDGNTFGNYSTWGKTPIEHSNNNRLHIK